MPKGSPVLDTVRVGAPISMVNTAAPEWGIRRKTTLGGEEEGGRRRKLDSGAVLDLRGGKAYIEASIPKLVNGRNYPGVDLPTVLGVLPDLIEEASEFVRFDADVPDFEVRRLDVVSDSDMGDPGRLGVVLSSLAAVPSMGSMVQAHFQDSSAGKAQTVTRRTKRSGGGTLYDKGQESKLPEAAGIARFEARERGAKLGRHLSLVSDLSDVEAVDDLGRARFSWCGFDVPMRTADEIKSLLMALNIRWETRFKLYGYLTWLREFGAVSLGARNTDWRYRKMIRDIGVLAPVSMRLDYDEGLVMAA